MTNITHKSAGGRCDLGEKKTFTGGPMGKNRFQKEKCYRIYLSQQVAAEQQLSAGVLQEFLNHAISDYLAKGTHPLSLRLSH